jgi:hypothetical protein
MNRLPLMPAECTGKNPGMQKMQDTSLYLNDSQP